jgi:adenine-specific DNA-methyltransferase
VVLAAVGSNKKDLYEQLLAKITTALTLTNGRKSHELERFEKNLFKGVNPKNFDGLLKQQRENLLAELAESGEEIDSVFEVETDESEGKEARTLVFSKEELESEATTILDFIVLSRKITKNTKGKALTDALDLQFKKAREEGWPEKAVIFTEFRSTQDYVLTVLEEYGMDPDKDVVIFNGSSGDAESRANLVADFRNSKKIFLTTEAGAEGLNLQFCNLIVNYDLPWNPQRIEQRIGRCHRYGQKLDVVVLNFVNEKNIADRRVLELLSEKFNLFQGAFGASDEVLGQIESGVDIEKKIFDLYLRCRSEVEIKAEFEKLMSENQESVDRSMEEAKQFLAESFDEEVQRKLKTRQERVSGIIDSRQKMVRDVFISGLKPGSFRYDNQVLDLSSLRGIETDVSRFTFSKLHQDDAQLLHANHPLFAARKPCCAPHVSAKFEYTGRHNISAVKDLVGRSGVFALFQLSVEALEACDYVIPVFLVGGERTILNQEVGDKILSVASIVHPVDGEIASNDLSLAMAEAQRNLDNRLVDLKASNASLYQEEVQKIETYFDDIREQKRYEIEELDKGISDLKRERMKAKFEDQRAINSEIQKLKDKVDRLESEITELRKTSRTAEKEKMSELERRVTLKSSISLIASGSFAIC